ncbi:hypothetical protein M514_02392 [Trichuris suis]|uniref:Mos1 transposase HTH domain-containing protein n=1 Tax=Trichuris suis TaxID=68888 RepID=A0A085MHM0_9BILA|nr:hypothetical protein M513_02392 [Trichuris suis]KFD64832.1 hypothetical protein M514_02392 [Trichuris suis]
MHKFASEEYPIARERTTSCHLSEIRRYSSAGLEKSTTRDVLPRHDSSRLPPPPVNAASIDVHHDCIQSYLRISVFPVPRVTENRGDVRFQQHAVIKFLFHEGVSSDEIHWRLLEVYKDDALSHPRVKFWIADFAGAENPSLTNQSLVGQLNGLMKMLQLWRRWFWRTEESRLQKSWHGISFLVAQLKAFYMITGDCQKSCTWGAQNSLTF